MAEGDYSDTRTVDKNGDAVVVRIEDDRTGMHPVTLERAVFDHLHYTCSKEQDTATLRDAYEAVAHSVRDRLVHRWIATQRAYNAEDAKRVYYISAEFLLGRALANNLISLGLYKVANRLLRRRGIHLGDLLEQEPDPGLGNGGLGRLAACFLDSMATLGLPGYGYGIRYEFGIFEQEFVDGAQVEHPDNWLRYGTPWEFPRYEYTVPVDFYGKTERRLDDNGRLRSYWVDTKRVHGVPYDTPIAGFGTLTVNTLRLWSARASQELDLVVFNDGDYRRAVEEKTISESISKVLYPKDQSEEGKELRLKQQYFFVCCSIRDIVRRYKSHHKDFRAFPDKVAIQLNDTHPAVAIPELMRLLVDEEGLRWDAAWDITRRTFAFTNHTLLSEALERWPVSTFGRLLPRHLEIIYEINHHFLGDIHVLFPEDEDRQRRMSVIEEGPEKQIRMAHLAVIGSHSVNGVAELHSRLVRTSLLKDFAEAWPDRFNNKTNGVTQRRWVLLANPRLATAITERIGRGWITDLSQLEQLLPLADDEGFLRELIGIKLKNKRDLARLIAAREHVEIDPDSMFDVHVKRIHEYKRQLMNALHIVTLYRAIRRDPDQPVVPRTFIFGGKAAPGYAMAKLFIRLINDIAGVVNRDPIIRGRIRVVFVANYGVSLAERIIPATDLSEQISMAGMEASGTGNMKLSMNGALTVGTLDGANIEIREAVGPDNFFLCGLTAEQAAEMKSNGYDPQHYIAASDRLRDAIELIDSGFFNREDRSRYRPVVDYLRHSDPYLVCADFEDYAACQERAAATFAEPMVWARMVLQNIARMGHFSSDRTIRQYAEEIWDVKPVTVEFEDAAISPD